jgi:hypothetical protein
MKVVLWMENTPDRAINRSAETHDESLVHGTNSILRPAGPSRGFGGPGATYKIGP